MKRLTILCAALTAAMFMNMSVYAGTSEVAAEVSAGTVCLPGADLTDVMGGGFIFSDQETCLVQANRHGIDGEVSAVLVIFQ